MYRVAQWATGAMGRTALRRVIDHPDLELVAVHVYSKDKVGLDAGDIARRPPTGVRATGTLAEVIAARPDVVIHTPRIAAPYKAEDPDVLALLAAGINVISTAGFHYPDAHGVAFAGPLRAACQAGASTLAGLGLNPGFVTERLALLLSGMCAQLTRISTFEIADASGMKSPDFVFNVMGFGTDPAKSDVTQGPLAAVFGDLFLEVFHAVASELGTSVESVEPQHRVTLAPRDLSIAAGTIASGTVAATEWRWEAAFRDGRRMVHSVTWSADPSMHGVGRHDAASWRVEIEGRPNIRLSMLIADPDPAAPHTRAGADATVALALRAIPEVCAAPAGFFHMTGLSPFSERFVTASRP